MDRLLPSPQNPSSFLEILNDSFCRKVFGHGAAVEGDDLPLFTSGLTTRLAFLLRNPANHLSLFKVGYACLEAFLQSNVTGPPLDFDPREVVFPAVYHRAAAELRKHISASLAVEGQAVYPLTPHIELFWVAKRILGHDDLADGFNGRRARVRVSFWHQKLLSEVSDHLRNQIYQDADVLEGQLKARLVYHGAAAQFHYLGFLIEKAVIDTYYGHGIEARKLLAAAAKMRGFEFALTGVLGRRTKFQQDDISQLVVLARSGEASKDSSSGKMEASESATPSQTPIDGHPVSQGAREADTAVSNPEADPGPHTSSPAPPKKPQNVPLKDDTLLESIHFTSPHILPEVIPDRRELPPALAELDPSSQPLLYPLDSAILLQTASSISNTSPSDGLTREETMPYATRVLEGGSSNWQVYTQALLIRSRIEGYRSRTAERGLLQLQALVDQVIVDTTPKNSAGQDDDSQASSTAVPTTFLPVARPSESAPATERLEFIYQLHPPLRWELEAELAARWVSMGGLKTALEIYSRLEMHADVALCLAATDNEAKAARLTRKLLFRSASREKAGDEQRRDQTGVELEEELDELPADAPRLFCILGDLEKRAEHYERAWTTSNRRYARAQRCLGRHHVRHDKNYAAAAEAYRKSLAVNRLDAATWFALGCVQLELESFAAAADSFTRTVQLEAEDAEAWSNLAAALIRLPEEQGGALTGGPGQGTTLTGGPEQGTTLTKGPEQGTTLTEGPEQDGPEDDLQTPVAAAENNPDQARRKRASHRQKALHALRHATRLKQSDARIWDNYLTVAASLIQNQRESASTVSANTTAPWPELIQAQSRLIDLRSSTLGEQCIDEHILAEIVRHVTTAYTYLPNTTTTDRAARTETEAPYRPGTLLPTQLQTLMTQKIQPLITSSPQLWILVAELEEWRGDTHATLQAWEKAWRAALAASGPGTTDSSSTERPRRQRRKNAASRSQKKRAHGKEAKGEEMKGITEPAEEVKKSTHSAAHADDENNEDEDEGGWSFIVDVTVRLVDAYRRDHHSQSRSQSRSGNDAAVGNSTSDTSTEVQGAGGGGGGGGGGGSGWRFKARSAVRKVMGLMREEGDGGADEGLGSDDGDGRLKLERLLAEI